MVAMVAPQLSAHGQRVSELSITLGQKLGLSAEELRTLEIASLLHDIGKISTGFSKLDSNSPEYKKHPETGQDILKYIPQLKTCSEIIRHHHENYDGSGFPDGLEEKNIPIGSRIIAITDTYDKLHINRKKRDIAVYNFLNTKKVSADNFKRKELFENGAMYYLQQNTFSLFDPDILKVMLDLIKSKKLNYKVEITVKPEELNTGDVITEPVYTDSGALLFTKDTKISDQELDKLTLILKSEALKTPLKIIENFSSNQ
jgi:HD-GYP domain-containing protein (c-di-GMP phosphodiesterase class II)